MFRTRVDLQATQTSHALGNVMFLNQAQKIDAWEIRSINPKPK